MPEIATLLSLGGLLLFIGAGAGVLAGLLGVGGGIVLVPAFYFTFAGLGFEGAQTMQVCLATSLATIVVTSARSVAAHNRKDAVDWEILRTWAAGIVVGAAVGVAAAASLRSSTLQGIFGVLALVVGAYLGLGRPEWRIAPRMPKGWLRSVLSPVLGFLSVLMGIGGGSFGVPLMSLFGVPIHRAVATASGFGMLIAVPAVAGFLFVEIDAASRPPFTFGAVNLPAFALVIAMTLMTTPVGVRLAHAMNPRPLKRVFAVFLTLVSLNMLLKALGW